MSWVSLSGSEGDSGKSSYKEVANEAFASPTNLSSRLVGNRTPREGVTLISSSNTVSSRRMVQESKSKDEAESLQQIIDSTAVKIPKVSKVAPNSMNDGLKSLSKRVSRQLQADSNSAFEGDEASGGDSKDSFSIGSVSRRTKDLDLAHNDNSFHVIGGLIVEFFKAKKRSGSNDLKLTAQDIAQLDRLAPPRVRASFVEAVRFRFTNAPMDSNNSVEILARQCHELGLDAEGSNNPLLAAAEIDMRNSVSSDSKKPGSSSSLANGSVIENRENASCASHASRRQNGSQTSVASKGTIRSDAEGASPASIASRRRVQGAYDQAAPMSSSSSSSHRLVAGSGVIKVGCASSASSRESASAGPEQLQTTSCSPNGRDEASVTTKLTALGVEVPFRSGDASLGQSSLQVPQASSNQWQALGAAIQHHQQGTAASVQCLATTSLTKFGMEMPDREDVGGGTSVVSDMKSMTTSLTKLGVEMPLQPNASSERSDKSDRSGITSRASVSGASGGVDSVSNGSKESAPEVSKGPVAVETVYEHAVSASKTDDSFVVPAEADAASMGLAKKQLMAELSEATNLLAESKTPEAAKFWRDHVLELEFRIRALDGVDTAPSKDKMTPLVREHARDSSQAGSSRLYLPPSHDLNSNASQVGEAVENLGGMSVPSNHSPLLIDPSLEGVPMVDVVAPADLPGGYHFEAEIEGRRFLATVPAGGVQKGETFSCYMRDLEKVGSDIPVGRWRDGLFDCCSTGCCHPVIANGLFCPLVLLGQIMTRVGFDFLGRPSLDNSINGPNTLWTILCFWVFVNFALFCAYNVKWSRGMELSMADLGALAFVNVSYMLFVVYLTSATRGSLREKYYIRESRFHDLEDCCCATFCLPCSVCQMARHTADYDEFESVCCNDTGLPDVYESRMEEISPKEASSDIV